MWSYNVAGSRSWAPVAGAPRPAAPTGSPIGAELYEGNHSIPRSPRAPPVEVWAGVFKSGGGGGAGGGGFRLDDCLRELGLGTGTAGARSASSGVASQRPAAKRFDESWAATCAHRRRQQGHREVQVSSAGCLGTLDFVSPSPSHSPRLDARRSTLDARRSPPLHRLMLLPSCPLATPSCHAHTPSHPHALTPSCLTLAPSPSRLTLSPHPSQAARFSAHTDRLVREKAWAALDLAEFPTLQEVCVRPQPLSRSLSLTRPHLLTLTLTLKLSLRSSRRPARLGSRWSSAGRSRRR